MTPQEKQEIWRQKQIRIFYGSGRPIFTMNKQNRYMRKFYDCDFYYSLQKISNPYQSDYQIFKQYMNVGEEK